MYSNLKFTGFMFFLKLLLFLYCFPAVECTREGFTTSLNVTLQEHIQHPSTASSFIGPFVYSYSSTCSHSLPIIHFHSLNMSKLQKLYSCELLCHIWYYHPNFLNYLPETCFTEPCFPLRYFPIIPILIYTCQLKDAITALMLSVIPR